MRLALPKGRLLEPTRTLLMKAGIELEGYDGQSRSYRPTCETVPGLDLKIFQEKDIPIQVAVGNYDLGICGLDWVEELLAKYAGSSLVKVCNLTFGGRPFCAAASRGSKYASLDDLSATHDTLRLASEYPNLAEAFALDLRLKRFKVYPLWGAAEAYQHESADIIIGFQEPVDNLAERGLYPLTDLFYSTAFLIANRRSWESKDLSSVIEPLCRADSGVRPSMSRPAKVAAWKGSIDREFAAAPLRIALPDGHQQGPTLELFERAGIGIEDYATPTRRPRIGLEGVAAKVIRPQDMPPQVANGNFDLAITGRDWLANHLYRFPTSPVQEVLNLKFGWVRIVACVTEQTPVHNIHELRELPRKAPLRVCSEYVNIADKYTRDNHLGHCRIIPTWGASEAFLPEDADLLIENTQTGRTLAEHKLRIIDTLFESTACLIGSTDSAKQERIAAVVEAFKRGL